MQVSTCTISLFHMQNHHASLLSNCSCIKLQASCGIELDRHSYLHVHLSFSFNFIFFIASFLFLKGTLCVLSRCLNKKVVITPL